MRAETIIHEPITYETLHIIIILDVRGNKYVIWPPKKERICVLFGRSRFFPNFRLGSSSTYAHKCR